jgi:DNA-binding MarR family transcriptional regulator
VEKNLDSKLASITLAKLSKRLDRLLEQEIRPLGLRRGQHAILLAVEDLGSPSFTELSLRLEVDKAAVTRSVAACEKHGWLKTSYAPDSLKTRQVALTRSGQQLTIEIKKALMTVEQALRDELPHQLFSLLKELSV